jgi:hypothetical protein
MLENKIMKILISVALGAVIAISVPAKAMSDGSSIDFKAMASVKRIARIKVLHQQPHMVISRENIAQGYVDMTAASRLEVRNSSQSGYVLNFEVQEGPFQHVFVRGLGNELQISFGNGWLFRPHSRTPELLELTYHFVLAADARPGTYPWPIQISASAI